MVKRIYILVNRLALLASQQGGYRSPQELAFTLGLASQMAFSALFPARGAKAAGPGLNRAWDTRLSPFVRRQEYRVDPSGDEQPIATGQFKLPADCAYVDYYDLPSAVTVEEVSGMALRYRRASRVDAPSRNYPLITTVERGEKQAYPADTEAVGLQYFCYPTEPVYHEIRDESDNAVYDDAGSVDMGWNLDMEPELVVRSLLLLGLEIRDPSLVSVAAQLVAQTP